MGTTTTTFALNKPTVGGDDNAWGTDWNTNADKLDDLLDGTTGITPNLISGWEVGGTAVTATAAELNVLDGVTASTAELNILDGVTASTAELNILDGVTASAAELNILDGVTATAAEINYLDITTLGTSQASKAVTADADGTVKFSSAIMETVYSLAGTVIDPANGTIQIKTLAANTTFTESIAAGESVIIMIDDGSAYSVTWPTTTWVNNGKVAPTLATTGYTVVALWKVSTTLYGALVGNGF